MGILLVEWLVQMQMVEELKMMKRNPHLSIRPWESKPQRHLWH